jgi:murein tripeptide amidase MpaA
MYRTVDQLNSLTGLLAAWFPSYFQRVLLPERSCENRPVYALRMRAGGGNAERRGVLLVGGTHARELMNPDAIVELAVDLLVSHALAGDIVYGGRRWEANDVKLILETLDVWMVPCSNPDGRQYVMTVDDMWRKNRRDNPSNCDGVDLNRNLDMLWGVTAGQTSCSQCSDVYCGPSAFSEPETRNVKYLLDTYRINCFVDVHSYSELVLYPWGHAPTQTTDPSKRFTGLPDGTCLPIGEQGYAEYMTPRDQQRFQTVAQRVVDAIAAVRGRAYTPQTGFALYGTTGTHGDYAYSRHITDPSLRKTYGFTFETGPYAVSAAESFHPADPEPVKRDAKSGMLALMQQCICAIELIGLKLPQNETTLSALRRVRDDLLATTSSGRAWIALFDRVQLPLVTALLRDPRLRKEAEQLIELAGRFVIEERVVLRKADLQRVSSFVERLAKTTKNRAIRSDLDTVSSELKRVGHLGSAEAIAELMRLPPRRTRAHEH